MAKMCLFEVRAPAPIPARTRVSGYAHGFRSESVLRYGSPRPWAGGFLSDLAFARSTTINGHHRVLLDDRRAFDALTRGITTRIPALFGHTEGDRFVPADGSSPTPLSIALDDLLRRHGRIVAKPVFGTSTGKGVWIVERDRLNGETRWNGRVIVEREVQRRLRRVGSYVVTEFVRQAEYARTIFPASTNTVRVLTMIDPDTGDAFPALAVHRFGTSRSQPIDAALAGGLAAPVDLQTGELGAAVHFTNGGRSAPHAVDAHPESGAPIAGVVIPGWEAALDELLAVANAVRDRLPYVGWDLVFTDDGFSIIEGNGRTWFGFQLNTPSFDDPRILRFFTHHGVLRARPDAVAGPMAST